MSVLKTCAAEGCRKYAHALGLCRQHYDEQRNIEKTAEMAGEAKAPQARGGRRDKYPPSRTIGLNTNGFRPGESGNPYGGSAVALEIYRRSSEETLHDSLPWLARIINDPETRHRDRILAIAIRDKIRVNSAELLYGRLNAMPAVGLLANDEAATPLTRIAANNKGDYESLLAERRRIDGELSRIDAARNAERDAKEDAIAAARIAQSNGEAVPAPLALLLKVRDEDC